MMAKEIVLKGHKKKRLTTFKIRPRRTLHGNMPLKNIVLQRSGDKVIGRVTQEFSVFLEDTLDGRGSSVVFR
jgi:hypothetical protein